jgi:S-formylglutathione hydrolase FrmB
MGRDIPVAFESGGRHAVFLLDAFNGGDIVSNWVSTGNAMNTLGGRGVSVVASAAAARPCAIVRPRLSMGALMEKSPGWGIFPDLGLLLWS